MRILIALLFSFPLLAFGVVETYEFKDQSLRERYQAFSQELRCPKCQNQNLAGSNSPIAADLRREVYRLLHEGRSDKEIVDYMVARYGEFVLYRPRLNAETLVLWAAPAALLLIGVVVVIVIIRRQRRQSTVDSNELSAEERARLDKLLSGENSND